MLQSITLKFGSSGLESDLSIPLSNVTVFVGPNNSGKSLALSEIAKFCAEGPSYGFNIIDNITPEPFTEEELKARVTALETARGRTDNPEFDDIMIRKIQSEANSTDTRVVRLDRLFGSVQAGSTDKKYFFEEFLSLHVLKLGGANRVELVNQTYAGDLQAPARNYLSLVFRDREKREEIRRIIQDAFGKYLVIDPTNLGTFRIALSEEPPDDQSIELALHEQAVKFYKQATEITKFSDGIKAFTGIVLAMVAGNPEIVLVDEPEAFLHPALSYKLGREIGASTRGSGKRVFVATHSASFLMGCSNSGAKVNVVRLTYTNGRPMARLLGEERLLQLMRNPLLRSTKVLEALFYEFVVVTEGDADRAFYQEINERLLNANDDRGIPNCLFINAQNSQTAFDIVHPLRELGIPAATIVDIDVLKNGGKVWNKALAGTNIPVPIRNAYHDMRGEAMKAFADANGDMKKLGLSLLKGDNAAAVRDIFDHLAEYGVFIVPDGELETWMGELGCEGHGPSWLLCIFEKLGEDPTSEEYVSPGVGDVWNFLGRVKGWLRDSERKGIPV